MTELAIQPHHSTGGKVRLAVIMVIALTYYLSWWWLDGLSRGHQQLAVVDQLPRFTSLQAWRSLVAQLLADLFELIPATDHSLEFVSK